MIQPEKSAGGSQGDHRGVMSLLYHLRLEKKLELEEKRAKVGALIYD